MTPFTLSSAAKRRLRSTAPTLLGWAVLLAGFPVLVASDIVGKVEFALPTLLTTGTVTEVRTFTPFHVRTAFVYDSGGRTVTQSSWASQSSIVVGQSVSVEKQVDYYDHARVLGQRKYAISITEALFLPLTALLLMVVGAVQGRRRVRRIEKGTLVEAELVDGHLCFEVSAPNPDAGYREGGLDRTLIRLPVRKSLRRPDGSDEVHVVTVFPVEEKAVVLGEHSLFVTEEAVIDEWRSRPRFQWIPVALYVGFLALLAAYYMSH